MAREMALQMLYQRDLGGTSLEGIFAGFDPVAGLPDEAAVDPPQATDRPPGWGRRKQVKEAFEYAKTLVLGTTEALSEIDRLIRRQADNWRLERMPPVDRNILRLAVFELLYEKEVPRLVVVDEAIELAKRYGSEQSSRFVNGLLDGLLKEVLTEEGSAGDQV